MASIIASNLPIETTKEQIQKFFEFCGKIKSINEETINGSKVFTITFLDSGAISTALLLNDAELNGSRIKITEHDDEPPLYVEEEGGVVTAEKEEAHETADIKQELKPKAAIFAEYLSQGYVLSDPLLQKAVDYDSKHGISENFNKFLNDIDSKYDLHTKSKDLDTKLGISKYFNKALQTNVGSKVESFYKDLAKDTKQINDEAKRLAELKKQQKNNNQ